MEPVHSPDAANEIASFRDRLRAFRDRGASLSLSSTAPGSPPRPENKRRPGQPGNPDTRDAPDTVWSDTQWTDTVFDPGDR